MQVYIGNLSQLTTACQIASLFLPFGIVRLSQIVHDENTGRSLGFGFVEMEEAGARHAIRKLHRSLFMNSYVEVTAVS